VLRVWLGTYLSLVIAALAVLFLASLVASPLAFRAERIYRERVEAERERERVQREAELRVVRKLDELSERVESVREHASEATSASVSDVAEDIDSTVAELRRILGDVVAKGDPDE
jgi:ABC-type transporter Mla subunit MlaD